MLEYLNVKNIALIDNVEINFEKGLNVLTGETGAGKSILIDSINLLLGNRIDKSLVRTGESFCKVVGKFSVDDYSKKTYEEYCKKYDLEYSDEILINRTYKIEGKNDIRINGEVVTLGMLKELCSFLVDSYGQNENQEIFNVANHLLILDAFAKTYDLPEYLEYRNNYDELKYINKKLKEFGGNEFERLKTIDLLKYQIDEIESANLSVNEYEELENNRHIMMNLGKIVSNTTIAQNSMQDDCLSNLSKAKNCLEQASLYDESLQSYADRIESAKIELDDILYSLKQYNDNMDFSEDKQQQIEDRLNLYNKLFRKYGKTVEEILQNKEEMVNQLDILENADAEISKLKKQKGNVLNNLYSFGLKISEHRKKYSKVLCELILTNLTKLSMQNARLDFKFEDIQNDEVYFGANGLDKVELLFSANLGEELKPLSKIASGGEISRFMLALKSVIAKTDNMPTMIFDEIDTGISGQTSEAVAKQMAVIGKSHQVIVVTHSHQIASMADVNFLIKKQEVNGRTNTIVEMLNNDQKVREIARFLSGDSISDISLNNAKELIKAQELYKKSI